MSEQETQWNEVAPVSDSADLPEGWLRVGALDMEAQGIARRPDGKVVFIEGALPFETLSVKVGRKKNNWEQGTVTEIHYESPQRVRPGCPHFGLHQGACGGCKMQHLEAAAQVAVKQRVLEDNLWHLGKVKPETVLRPIEGPAAGTVSQPARARPDRAAPAPSRRRRTGSWTMECLCMSFPFTSWAAGRRSSRRSA